MKDIHIDIGGDNEAIITIHLRPTKAAQYNEGGYKNIKRDACPVFPAKMWPAYFTHA